jgi:hypothetical protein
LTSFITRDENFSMSPREGAHSLPCALFRLQERPVYMCRTNLCRTI